MAYIVGNRSEVVEAVVLNEKEKMSNENEGEMIPMPPPIPPPLPPSLQTIGDKQERKNEATEVNLMEAIVIASSLNSFIHSCR